MSCQLPTEVAQHIDKGAALHHDLWTPLPEPDAVFAVLSGERDAAAIRAERLKPQSAGAA